MVFISLVFVGYLFMGWVGVVCYLLGWVLLIGVWIDHMCKMFIWNNYKMEGI